MDHSEILDAMKARRDALDTAIAALTGEHGQPTHHRRRRRHMSAAARSRISEMMKKNWAKRKLAKKAA